MGFTPIFTFFMFKREPQLGMNPSNLYLPLVSFSVVHPKLATGCRNKSSRSEHRLMLSTMENHDPEHGKTFRGTIYSYYYVCVCNTKSESIGLNCLLRLI